MNKQYKMYKSGKNWVYSMVAVSLLTFGVGFSMQSASLLVEHSVVKADHVEKTAIQSAPDSIFYDTNHFPNISDISSRNPLGIASLFSIFSKNANLGADVNGNVATQTLSNSNRDFGTNTNNMNNSDIDLSYIQNLSGAINDRAFRSEKSAAIFGRSVKLTNDDGHISVDFSRVSTLNSDNTFQDQNGKKYIDFDDYFEQLAQKSDSYINTAQTEGVSVDFSDMNKQVIDVSKANKTSGYIYVDVDYSKLNGPQPITIKGLSSQINGTNVIINVNNAPTNSSTQTQINYVYDNGQLVSGNSENHVLPNHVVWNFGSKIEQVNVSSGRLLGSILAPSATVNAGVNIDGNIVANNVNISGGESHRWDVTTPSSDTPSSDTPSSDTPSSDVPSSDVPSSDTPRSNKNGEKLPDAAKNNQKKGSNLSISLVIGSLWFTSFLLKKNDDK